MSAGSLGFSVTLYSICAVMAIALITIRRFTPFFGQAELGGPTGPKYASGIFLVFLWILYVLLASLQVYGVIESPF